MSGEPGLYASLASIWLGTGVSKICWPFVVDMKQLFIRCLSMSNWFVFVDSNRTYDIIKETSQNYAGLTQNLLYRPSVSIFLPDCEPSGGQHMVKCTLPQTISYYIYIYIYIYIVTCKVYVYTMYIHIYIYYIYIMNQITCSILLAFNHPVWPVCRCEMFPQALQSRAPLWRPGLCW